MRRGARLLSGSAAQAVLGTSVSAVFLLFFLRGENFGAVGDAFTRASVPLIVLSGAVYFAGVWFRAVRLHYLFRPLRPVSPRAMFPLVAIGYAANNILPAETGEVVRAHLFWQRFQVSRMAGLGSVVMERLFDGLMLTVFLAVGVAASVAGAGGMPFAGNVLLGVTAFLVGGVSAAFAIAYGIATHPEAAERRGRALLQRVPVVRRADPGWVRAFVEGISAVADRRLVLAATWTSGAAWGLEAVAYWLVGLGFDLHQPFPVYLLIVGAANSIIAAPATNGGVGPFEWATKAVLLIFLTTEQTPEAEEIAVAYAASLHALVLIPITAVGLLYLWRARVPRRMLAPPDPGPPDGK